MKQVKLAIEMMKLLDEASTPEAIESAQLHYKPGALLKKAPGVTVLDERKPGGYPTAATEAANRDTVYVGRIREDISSDRGLNLWVVSDNVRKGAATNSVQIAEIMVRDYI